MKTKDVSSYILKLAEEKKITINNNSDLFEMGILDSLGTILLITELNSSLNINISFDEISSEDFRTIDNIQKLVFRLS